MPGGFSCVTYRHDNWSRNQSVSAPYALLCFCKIQLVDFAQALIAGITSSVTRTLFEKINLARDRVVMPCNCNCGFLLYEKTTHVISFALASTIFAQGETAVWPREITTWSSSWLLRTLPRTQLLGITLLNHLLTLDRTSNYSEHRIQISITQHPPAVSCCRSPVLSLVLIGMCVSCIRMNSRCQIADCISSAVG